MTELSLTNMKSGFRIPSFQAKVVYVFPESGMQRRIIAFDRNCVQVMTSDYLDVHVGIQPQDVFEVPEDYELK